MFNIIAAVIFGGLGIIWERNGWLNVWLKILFVNMALWGAWETMTAAGYIVKAS